MSCPETEYPTSYTKEQSLWSVFLEVSAHPGGENVASRAFHVMAVGKQTKGMQKGAGVRVGTIQI